MGWGTQQPQVDMAPSQWPPVAMVLVATVLVAMVGWQDHTLM